MTDKNKSTPPARRDDRKQLNEERDGRFRESVRDRPYTVMPRDPAPPPGPRPPAKTSDKK